ncbi:MAG: DUF1254 domain-containing protein, partial [Thiogranum sp.]
MKWSRLITLIIICLQLGQPGFAQDTTQAVDKSKLSVEEVRQLAEEAYIFGFAIVENYKALYGMCVYDKSPQFSGFNHYLHGRKLFGPQYKTVVSANNDTYYSTTWADLKDEPLVIKVPPTGDRYFVIQLVDMFTDNFAYIGTRATGKKGGVFLLVGPDNKVSVPGDKFDRVITSRSRYVALATREATDGTEADARKVFALQDKLELIPLHQYMGWPPFPVTLQQPDFPPYDAKQLYSKPRLLTYLNIFLEWQVPAKEEKDLMQRLSKINVGPYLTFDIDAFSPEIRQAIREGIDSGHKKIVERANNLGQRVNGWEYTPPMGDYGQDYLFRSAVAYKFIYTNSPEEAIYPIAEADSKGEPLDGSQGDYVLHFDADQLPPVNAFWSMTMYHSDSRLMVENPINRYSIGDRTKGLKYEKDGSLNIYIQKNEPAADRNANWLPAPNGPFYVIARLYMP